jgi:ATP-dependent RNA helicase DeaD
MDDFSTLGLPQPLMQSLERMNFTTPTPIQAQAIPPALQGRDILGSAQTGTGKTGAFGIPLVAKLMNSPRGAAIVMTPTRELAVQVMKMLEELLGKKSGINTALLIGGEPYPRQMQDLRNQPRLIVGTPGRINDHIERRTLLLHLTDFLVLDETDRMLDMGFTDQIEAIIKFLPKKRQTLLFSATLPSNIVRIAQNYMVDPVRVAVDPKTMTAPKIKQTIMQIAEKDKYDTLVSECKSRDGSIIVFVKTKWNAEKMAQRLRTEHIDAEAIHGDLRQNKRDKVIKNFRAQKYRVMVATDIAARGLDIPHIEHVINYDLPQMAEDYVHRIGRTARAGAEGEALCFVTPTDKAKWSAIQRLIDPDNAPAFRPADNKPKSRNRGKPAGKFGEKRAEGRFEGRSDTRKDSRGENRGEGRKEGRSEARSENRVEARGEKKPYAAKPFADRSDRADRPQREQREPRQERGERSERTERTSEISAPRRKPAFARNDEVSTNAAPRKPRQPRVDASNGDKPMSRSKPAARSGRPSDKQTGKPAGKSFGKPAGKPAARKAGAAKPVTNAAPKRNKNAAKPTLKVATKK